ncbi:hypothetical protein C8R44DRAFT_946097, partial [Mycena epipterygia]
FPPHLLTISLDRLFSSLVSRPPSFTCYLDAPSLTLSRCSLGSRYLDAPSLEVLSPLPSHCIPLRTLEPLAPVVSRARLRRLRHKYCSMDILSQVSTMYTAFFPRFLLTGESNFLIVQVEHIYMHTCRRAFPNSTGVCAVESQRIQWSIRGFPQFSIEFLQLSDAHHSKMGRENRMSAASQAVRKSSRTQVKAHRNLESVVTRGFEHTDLKMTVRTEGDASRDSMVQQIEVTGGEQILRLSATKMEWYQTEHVVGVDVASMDTCGVRKKYARRVISITPADSGRTENPRQKKKKVIFLKSEASSRSSTAPRKVALGRRFRVDMSYKYTGSKLLICSANPR